MPKKLTPRTKAPTLRSSVEKLPQRMGVDKVKKAAGRVKRDFQKIKAFTG